MAGFDVGLRVVGLRVVGLEVGLCVVGALVVGLLVVGSLVVGSLVVGSLVVGSVVVGSVVVGSVVVGSFVGLLVGLNDGLRVVGLEDGFRVVGPDVVGELAIVILNQFIFQPPPMAFDAKRYGASVQGDCVRDCLPGLPTARVLNADRSILPWLVMSASCRGFFFTENDRHADMSRDMSGADTDHVGDIELCRLLRRRVDVVSA